MKALERAFAAADRFQRRRAPLAFPVAVWRKYSDDQAGYLAAQIAYYGFCAIFPLALLLITVLSLVLKSNPELRRHLVDSTLAQYPLIGPQLSAGLQPISETGLSLVVGVVFLLFGARGLANSMQDVICQVWGVDRASRSGFPWSQLRGVALVVLIGTGFLVTTSLAAAVAGASNVFTGVGADVATVVIAFVLNVGLFLLGFRIATAGQVSWRDLRAGAVVAAVAWELLQVAGGYLLAHQVRRRDQLYGTFSLVLGLLAWLYLQATVTLCAAEIDVVLARRLWPRSLLRAKGKQARRAADRTENAGSGGQAGGDEKAASGEQVPRTANRDENAGSSV